MPAPELLALVLCDTAAVDSLGKVSLQGLFDCIWASGFPTRHHEFSIFWKAHFSAPGSARVVIQEPSGQPMVVMDRVDVAQPGLAQAIHVMKGPEFSAAGAYLVRLLADQGVIGETALEVRMRQ